MLLSMTKKFNQFGFRQVLQEKRTSRILRRLLRMLVSMSGIATAEQLDEVHNLIREINDSVDIVARHLKRQADREETAPREPSA
jgi:hypothetical protein